MDGMLLSGIIHRSLIGCYSILLVLLVRLFLKRISRKYCYVLWIVVFLNLCIPFSIFSSFSLIPQRVMDFSVDYEEQAEKIASNIEKPAQNMIVFSENGTFSSVKDIQEVIPQIESDIQQAVESGKEKPVSKELLFVWLERIWVFGIATLGLYSFLAAIQFKKRFKNGNLKVYDKQERIFTLQGLGTPILWGFIAPRIYLPEDLEAEERTYIIEHEKCHRRRRDHMVKPILYAITIVYWFHPLVWFSYRLCCQDMEVSCDELVLERSEQSIRKDYARSLLKYAAKQNGFLLKPLTFGESSLRSRIVHVLKYRKRGVLVTAAAVAVCIFVAAGLILRPGSNNTNSEIRPENSPEKMEMVSSDVSVINNSGEVVRSTEYLSDPLPGIPCENPVDHGWNLENAKDIRKKIAYMSYIPEKGTEGYTYLIGQTNVFTLYGMGDYKTMLLECEGKHAEIRYEYASNYMTPLELMEIDLDRDGKEELAIKFNIKHGTGLSIDTFLLADFGTDDQLYVHQFLDEDFTARLAEHLSFEKKSDGIQPMVDGQPAGFFTKNREDVDPFLTATVGAQMHFYYDQLKGEIQLSGDIMLLWDDIGGIYDVNSSDVTGTVHWDGEHFYLDNFTSKNRSLEEQITYALQELYHVPKLHYVNVRYDSSKMNQDKIVITAEILPEGTDSSFDYAEIHLERATVPYSVSGWDIEDIYLEK